MLNFDDSHLPLRCELRLGCVGGCMVVAAWGWVRGCWGAWRHGKVWRRGSSFGNLGPCIKLLALFCGSRVLQCRGLCCGWLLRRSVCRGGPGLGVALLAWVHGLEEGRTGRRGCCPCFPHTSSSSSDESFGARLDSYSGALLDGVDQARGEWRV